MLSVKMLYGLDILGSDLLNSDALRFRRFMFICSEFSITGPKTGIFYVKQLVD